MSLTQYLHGDGVNCNICAVLQAYELGWVHGEEVSCNALCCIAYICILQAYELGSVHGEEVSCNAL